VNTKTGTVLGDAELIGETTGHIRLIMQWADDNQQAGYIARQRTNNFMRRVSRGVGAGGRVVYASDEQRDGIGQVTKMEREDAGQKIEDRSSKLEASEPTRATVPTPNSELLDSELSQRERALSEEPNALDFL
jgi:hypothetical protein